MHSLNFSAFKFLFEPVDLELVNYWQYHICGKQKGLEWCNFFQHHCHILDIYIKKNLNSLICRFYPMTADKLDLVILVIIDVPYDIIFLILMPN